MLSSVSFFPQANAKEMPKSCKNYSESEIPTIVGTISYNLQRARPKPKGSRLSRPDGVASNCSTDSLEESASIASANKLDPYIDAVQVRSRVKNKRGHRVKAASVPVVQYSEQTEMKENKVEHHEALSSYYKKSVHIEKSNDKSELWDHSSVYGDSSDDSDDSDDDFEHDDDEHHDKHKGKHKKHYKKKHKRPKGYKKKKKGKYPHKKGRHYKRKKKYPKVYVAKIQPVKGHYHGHGGHGGDYLDKHQHGYGKSKDYHQMGKHGDHGGYDKYGKHDNYGKYDKYGKYDEHGKHGDKKKHVVHLTLINGHESLKGGPKLGHSYGGKQAFSLAGLLGQTLLCVNYLLLMKQPSIYHEPHSHYYTKYSPSHHHEHPLKSSPPSGTIILAHCGELSAPTHPLVTPVESHLAASSELSGLVQQDAKQVKSNRTLLAAEQRNPDWLQVSWEGRRTWPQASGNFLSPLQQYLSNVLPPRAPLPASEQDDEQPNQVISLGPQRNRFVVDQNLASGPHFPNSRARLVQTRNNLLELRSRPVDVQLRVVSVGRFFGPTQSRPLRLQAQEPPSELDSPEDPLGRPQSDQPRPEVDGDRRQGHLERRVAPSLAVDMPEFALTGDSLELSCRHNIPMGQLYSVKWYKNSVEFYRFIPRNPPPEVRSSLMLPDTQVDLSRSNSQLVLLRNVSHRTSGLYRCEIVTEAPQFELLWGERQVRVYSLPDQGPQLALVEAPPRGLAGTARGETGRPEGGPQQMLRLASAGPLLRCVSDRSNPVAQMRFFINNQLVDLSRTVENLTFSYSDGLESNLVSMGLQLDDFLMLKNPTDSERGSAAASAGPAAPLDRAASLSGDHKGQRNEGSSAAAKPTDSAAKTSNSAAKSTTSNTEKVTNSTVEPRQTGANKTQSSQNANAAVQFDDEPVTPLQLGGDKNNSKNRSSSKKEQKKNVERRKDASHSGGARRANETAARQPKRPASAGSLDNGAAPEVAARATDNVPRTEASPVGASGRANPISDMELQRNVQSRSNNRHWNLVASQNYGQPILSSGSQLDKTTVDKPAEVNKSATMVLDKMDKMEQKILAAEQQQQQQARPMGGIYSNFIRIKCASLVEPLRYEMTSEMSVPLTVLVPANRLVDANELVRRSNLDQSTSPDSANNFDTPNTQPRLRPRSDEEAPFLNRNGMPRAVARNGGSLQTPRAVVIDREAQATRQGGQMSAVVYAATTAAPKLSPLPRLSQSEAGGEKGSNNGASHSQNDEFLRMVLLFLSITIQLFL